MSAAIDYSRFLSAKAQSGADAGFEPIDLPATLFGFQRDLVGYAACGAEVAGHARVA